MGTRISLPLARPGGTAPQPSSSPARNCHEQSRTARLEAKLTLYQNRVRSLLNERPALLSLGLERPPYEWPQSGGTYPGGPLRHCLVRAGPAAPGIQKRHDGISGIGSICALATGREARRIAVPGMQPVTGFPGIRLVAGCRGRPKPGRPTSKLAIQIRMAGRFRWEQRLLYPSRGLEGQPRNQARSRPGTAMSKAGPPDLRPN